LTWEDRCEGAWIFLSHSHKDLEKVRRIRDAFETRGHNPLMFFLRCLDDDSELDDLIRREIEARTWFVLADSPNARASRWVKEELEIIESLDRTVFRVIDLDADLEAQLEQIRAFSKRASVYLSYAGSDLEVADLIVAELCRNDFRVLGKFDTRETDLADEITEGIDEAVAHGFVLVLMSPDSWRSRWMAVETDYVLERSAATGPRSNVIPVIVRDRERTLLYMPEALPLQYFQYFDLTTGDRDTRVAELVQSLKTREME
jgi:hypothetical protein